jgi:3-oxoacyl-[acyl-carrier protein] reductase
MTGVSLALDGKVALVTGGSRGIGAETVRLFREAGARVAFSYRKARAQADALVAECNGTGGTGAADKPLCIAIEQELSTPADGRKLVESAVAAMGRLDILVANHGVWEAEDVPIAQMDEAQWRHTLAVNLDAVFGLVQAAVAQMLRQSELAAVGAGLPPQQAKSGLAGGPGRETRRTAGRETGGTTSGTASRGVTKGHIVLISSTAGQRGEAFHADYAVTKGALISLTKSLSTELAPKGIYVNCVAPGWVATDMSKTTLADPATGETIAAAIPVGRVATAREIAGPIVFLCTPLAGFISGEVLNVNGGAVLVG